LGCIAPAGNLLSFSALTQTYMNGLSYLPATMIGDLCYSLMLFGGFYLVQYQFPILNKE
jgi:hypothetical protein